MNYTLEFLSNHVKSSIELSDQNKSKLCGDILKLRGFSGIKTRHLYNNICNLNNINYLEIGPSRGSSFISAIYENNINPVAVDNWSQFGNHKKELLENINKFYHKKFTLIEKDCLSVTLEDIIQNFSSVDIFLNDGDHTYESQKQTIIYYKKFLSTNSIIIVDDWLFDATRKGTFDGLKESNIKIYNQFELINDQNITGKENYWNGYGIFICEIEK